MDTSLEEDSQTSSILRVYYEPPTWSTSELGLLSILILFVDITDIGTFTEPKKQNGNPCYHGNHDLLNLKFRKMTVWL